MKLSKEELQFLYDILVLSENEGLVHPGAGEDTLDGMLIKIGVELHEGSLTKKKEGGGAINQFLIN